MQHRKSQAVGVSGWHGIGESLCSAKPPRSPLMSCRASGHIMTEIQLSQSGIARLPCSPLPEMTKLSALPSAPPVYRAQ